TERNDSLLESANGSMATVATRPGENLVEQKPKRIHLTPTGLLMEGDYAQNPVVGVMAIFQQFGVTLLLPRRLLPREQFKKEGWGWRRRAYLRRRQRGSALSSDSFGVPPLTGVRSFCCRSLLVLHSW